MEFLLFWTCLTGNLRCEYKIHVYSETGSAAEGDAVPRLYKGLLRACLYHEMLRVSIDSQNSEVLRGMTRKCGGECRINPQLPQPEGQWFLCHTNRMSDVERPNLTYDFLNDVCQCGAITKWVHQGYCTSQAACWGLRGLRPDDGNTTARKSWRLAESVFNTMAGRDSCGG